MGERLETLAVEGTPRLDLRLKSGSVLVLPGEPGRVEVRVAGRDPSQFVIEQFGDRIALHPEEGLSGRWAGFDLTLRVPEGSDLHARVASADLEVEAVLGGLRIDSASGGVRVGEVDGEVEVRSASGDVMLRRAGGRTSLSTASGEVRIERAEGSLSFQTASGDLRVTAALDEVTARSASGDVHLERFEGSELTCKTVSGEVIVGLPSGRTFEVDLSTLSGDITQDFPVTGRGVGTARLSVRTVSGDIVLRSAG